MRSASDGQAQPLQDLSALADGEVDAAAAARACAHWRTDPLARSSWHAYHLIGDVLRSDELASDAVADAGFLGALRLRLADEPAVVAPRPIDAAAVSIDDNGAPAARATGRSWMLPAALAASLMAVATVLVVTRGTGPEAEATLARARPDGGSIAAPRGEVLQDAPTLVADGKLIRDARLDRYLAAHSQFGGSSALGVPSGFLRAATTQAPDR
jgi:sigma-E factor negative regulatory protein RseA